MRPRGVLAGATLSREPREPHAVARLLSHPLGPLPRQAGQRRTVVVFGLVGLLMAAGIVAGAPLAWLRWLYTPPIAALALLALAARPRTPTQRLATLALFLSVVGDAFLVGFLVPPGGAARLAGIGSFALAYVALVAAFWRGRPRRAEALVVLAFGGLVGALLAVIWPTTPDALRAPVLVFGLVITLMGWTTMATTLRGRFPARPAVWVATMGVLIVTGDALVALDMFHPAFTPVPLAVELYIRVSYLAGWLLILLAIQERPGIRPLSPPPPPPPP